MSYDRFVQFIMDTFGENAKVKNDREHGLFWAKSGEWRISLNPNGKRVRIYNVRSRTNIYEEIAAVVA